MAVDKLGIMNLMGQAAHKKAQQPKQPQQDDPEQEQAAPPAKKKGFPPKKTGNPAQAGQTPQQPPSFGKK